MCTTLVCCHCKLLLLLVVIQGAEHQPEGGTPALWQHELHRCHGSLAQTQCSMPFTSISTACYHPSPSIHLISHLSGSVLQAGAGINSKGLEEDTCSAAPDQDGALHSSLRAVLGAGSAVRAAGRGSGDCPAGQQHQNVWAAGAPRALCSGRLTTWPCWPCAAQRLSLLSC